VEAEAEAEAAHFSPSGGDPVHALAVVGAGTAQWVLAVGRGRRVELWSVAVVGQEAQVCFFEGHEGPVLCLAGVPGRRVVVSGSFDSTVRVWDAEAGGEVERLNSHKSSVCALVPLPDGTLASGSNADDVLVWRLRE
jgi:WD40 repeat protein